MKKLEENLKEGEKWLNGSHKLGFNDFIAKDLSKTTYCVAFHVLLTELLTSSRAQWNVPFVTWSMKSASPVVIALVFTNHFEKGKVYLFII